MEDNVLTVLSPTDILEKEFRTELRGYSVNEVDDFLDIIINDYTKMYSQIEKLRSENKKLINQLKDLESETNASTNNKIVSNSTTNYDILKRVNLLEKQIVEIMKHLRKKNY